MWPPAVEEVAVVFRQSAIDARLEELATGEDDYPGAAVRAAAFHCDGGLVVALVPADSERIDTHRLGCVNAYPVRAPAFPYRGASVAIDQSLFNERVVWIEAGSPRHVAGLSPVQLARLLRARPGDLVLTDRGQG